MRGHSRSKNGVASLAYDARIHHFTKRMDRRVKPGDDDGENCYDREIDVKGIQRG